jgi:hypothetical protein
MAAKAAIVLFLPLGSGETQNPLPRRDCTNPWRLRSSYAPHGDDAHPLPLCETPDRGQRIVAACRGLILKI